MKKKLKISQLIVNPENYRFDPVDTQEQAIDEMLEKKGGEIANLAEHILGYGFDKSKDLRVLQKGSSYLVLDGNRRIAAAKCLIDPSLIKNKTLKSKFNKILSNSKKKPPIEVDCYVYKNEEDAALWIRLDHTGKNDGIGQDPWGPAEQDRFDYKFGGKKSPATQLVDLYTLKTGKSINTKALKISTINRLVSNPESRSYLGIDIPRGEISLLTDEQEVISRLSMLFKKVIDDNVPVSEVYRAPQAASFMKDLFGDKPQMTKQASATTSVESDAAKKRVFPKSTTRPHLIPKDCVLRIKPQKINNIYRELRDDLILDNTPRATPNAVGVLFRVFLEVSLDYFAEKICGKKFKSDETINQKINFVTGCMEGNKLATGTQLKNISATSSARMTDILHIQRFHEYVHSATVQPDSSTLKAKWDRLQEFFEILWGELEKQGK